MNLWIQKRCRRENQSFSLARPDTSKGRVEIWLYQPRKPPIDFAHRTFQTVESLRLRSAKGKADLGG
jgi:hypothetical protein